MEVQDGAIAAIQLSTTDDVKVNLVRTGQLLRDAAETGATLAILPENFAFMGAKAADKLRVAESDGQGPIQDFLAQAARTLGIWIIAGTLPLRCPDDRARVAPACLVYDAQGRRVARYDKIHLFDVDVPGLKGGRYRESATVAAGPPTVSCVDTPLGRVGLSVCYDLRFPELYRRLVSDGAEILSVPSAFTMYTGRVHWDLLVRARAVENQCWVVAPAQCGSHPDGRPTWGHSLIVDPWGEVLAACKEGEGVATALLSRQRLQSLRKGFPVLSHRRL